MDELVEGRIAAPGVAECGVPTMINAGDVVVIGRGTPPSKKTRRRTRRAQSGQIGLVRNHRVQQSMCPVGVPHGCQSITRYYDGRCLVSFINEGGFSGDLL